MDQITQRPSIPEIPVDLLDGWLAAASPSVEEAAEMVYRFRDLSCQMRIAESHIVGYVRTQLDLAEDAEDPEILDADRHAVDY